MLNRMTFLLLALLFIGSSILFADQYVRGYTRSDGAYVNGYYRSDADGNSANNYSSSGNVNPYTGQRGYRQY